jgi:hypothetical protein
MRELPLYGRVTHSKKDKGMGGGQRRVANLIAASVCDEHSVDPSI